MSTVMDSQIISSIRGELFTCISNKNTVATHLYALILSSLKGKK